MSDEAQVLMQRRARRCVTHHHACDCREDAVCALLKEVMWWHSDPTLPSYNGCDTDPCLWCESAKRILGEGTQKPGPTEANTKGFRDE